MSSGHVAQWENQGHAQSMKTLVSKEQSRYEKKEVYHFPAP